MKFEDFVKGLGFIKYPFGDRTAEKEDTEKLFIRPSEYQYLEDAFEKKQTIIINGNRGTGKTIIEDELRRKTAEKRLVCYVDNYETVPLEDNILEFYSLILQQITKELLVFLNSNKSIMRKMKKDQRIFVSFLIQKYGDVIADSQLQNQIEDVQLNKVQKIINKFSSLITRIINYGFTAAANFGNSMLNKTFGNYFPNIQTDEIKEIFPEIRFGVENDFRSIEISYSVLNNALKRVQEIVGHKPIVLFDRFDEDSRIENDSEILSGFVKSLLSDNKLLLNENIQLVIAIWTIAFESLTTVFRKSKHFVFDIKWDHKYLLDVLNQRLRCYSNNDSITWEDIIEDKNEIDDILNLANSNPRDLWDLMDKIIRAQYSINPNTTKLSCDAIKRGKEKFIAAFNFYEYYPKRKNSRKNTNDVYSYIKHLLTLDNTDEFTNEELKQRANTGGSTTNYITQMMTMGLVSKTPKKRIGGAVIYKINDPKVVYAIKNHIEIAV